MKNFKEITANELDANVFNLIGKDWTLITAGNLEKYNTMTASWGGVGVLWNKNVATIFVRPQRYTYEFVEENDYFTLSFFGGEKREELTFCGRNSGRDCNKAKECNLTAIDTNNGVAFEESNIILVCKKMYYNDIDPQNFLDDSINNHYNNDYHRMYIGEIVKVLVKE